MNLGLNKFMIADTSRLIGEKKLPHKTENGYLAPYLHVDFDTFPLDEHGEYIFRDDAYKCGWLDISPYHREAYYLEVGTDMVVRYVPFSLEKSHV